MTTQPPAPSHNALSAMPGDRIKYLNPDNGVDEKVVKTAGWQPSGKGGKIWSYETVDGVIVPNTQVMDVIKGQINSLAQTGPDLVKETLDEFLGPSTTHMGMLMKATEKDRIYVLETKQEIYRLLEDIGLSANIKVAIHCAIEDDIKSLEVASHLLKIRAKMLRELKSASKAL